MKKYIKPEIKLASIALENCILAGSISVGISEDPATGPEDYDEDYAAPIRRLKSLWDD